jgi:hypothetical protein
MTTYFTLFTYFQMYYELQSLRRYILQNIMKVMEGGEFGYNKV